MLGSQNKKWEITYNLAEQGAGHSFYNAHQTEEKIYSQTAPWNNGSEESKEEAPERYTTGGFKLYKNERGGKVSQRRSKPPRDHEAKAKFGPINVVDTVIGRTPWRQMGLKKDSGWGGGAILIAQKSKAGREHSSLLSTELARIKGWG